jgi:CubicO group peptidase (beta-lactamase class C family)
MGWPDDPSTAGMFLFRREIAGGTWWGHGGYWGTTAYTYPALDVTIVAGHQRSNMPESFDRLTIFEQALAALELA